VIKEKVDSMDRIKELRQRIDKVNQQLLKLLNERAQIALEIGLEKRKSGHAMYDPIREKEILDSILKENQGPFSNEVIAYLFKEIFKATLALQKDEFINNLKISRKYQNEDTLIKIKGEIIGGSNTTYIFGPCSIESVEQLEEVAKLLVNKGLKFIRGGAYKPRTSPYDFQGLGFTGVKIMKEITDKYNLISVIEVLNEKQLEEAYDYIDIIQIGSRNMDNFSLLRSVGQTNKPVILKRGYSSTIEEFKLAAEYIVSEGNQQVILCERGIRTFETATRNTLDISAIPILKKETHLPVIVDVSHAAGRKDIMTLLAKASLAANCNGIMAEIHPNPFVALSDSHQQMNFAEFESFYQALIE